MKSYVIFLFFLFVFSARLAGQHTLPVTILPSAQTGSPGVMSLNGTWKFMIAVGEDGKENIQMQVRELVTQILEDYQIGLSLVDVKIQDAEPPTQEVIEAFKAVETAKQKAETVINDAKAYQNAQLPKAQAQADQLVQNAEYLRQKRINEAIEQVAMFNARYQEYANDPQITRSRMYYEAISDILPGVKLYINTGSGGNMQMLLPLEQLLGNVQGESSHE